MPFDLCGVLLSSSQRALSHLDRMDILSVTFVVPSVADIQTPLAQSASIAHVYT